MKTLSKKILSALFSAGIVVALAGFMSAGGVSPASADSCWDHNGSLMRIVPGGGGRRTIEYENAWKNWHAPAGVFPGTILFNGTFQNGRYSGTARRFSKGCPNNPQTYHVSGPANSQRITLRGKYNTGGCAMNGQLKNDTLVFTFKHAC